MDTRIIRMGTRGSALALAQARWVEGELQKHAPGCRVETVVIRTSGDRVPSGPVQALDGKGIFVKEIEDALLRGDIDLAVHSMKDLPTEISEGLTVAAVPRREDARDVLVSRDGVALKDLPAGSRIGTGSLRRQSQILHLRPDLKVIPVRGNVDTRIKKLDNGEFEGLIVAAAGLKRIGLEKRISEFLSPAICVSAVAQGALGLQSRIGSPIAADIAVLHHEPSAAEVLAERAFLRGLGGGCQVPIGARGYVESGKLTLIAMVADSNGKKVLRGEISGEAHDAEQLGKRLARRLWNKGADKVLQGGLTPLSGRCVMITRPRRQAGPLVRALESLGSQVIEFPTIQIVPPESYVPLDKAIESIRGYDWIVFTSANGVREFMGRLRHLGWDVSRLEGIRLAAIGPETAERLSSQGLKVELVPGEYRAEGLLRELGAQEVGGKRFLLPRAAVARDVLPKILRERGAEVDVVQAYRTVPVKSDAVRLRELLVKKKVDMVTFTSSSTVNCFLDALPPENRIELLKGIAIACIGPVTQKTAEQGGIRVDVVAQEYTVPGLIQSVLQHFGSKSATVR